LAQSLWGVGSLEWGDRLWSMVKSVDPDSNRAPVTHEFETVPKKQQNPFSHKDSQTTQDSRSHFVAM